MGGGHPDEVAGALAGLQVAEGAEAGVGGRHGGAAEPQHPGQFALAGEPDADRQPSVDHQEAHPLGEVAVGGEAERSRAQQGLQVVGRPFMYATTREFLIRFGLRDLSDLPKIEEMAEALGFDVPAGLTQPSPAQAQLDLLGGAAPLEEVETMSTDVEPGEKIH